jgi:hypothetical protein
MVKAGLKILRHISGPIVMEIAVGYTFEVVSRRKNGSERCVVTNPRSLAGEAEMLTG